MHQQNYGDCVTDSRNQNWPNIQHLNRTLSTAERSRRLIPYVTYYVAGDDNDNDVQQQQQQQQQPQQQYQYHQTGNFNPNILRPVVANDVFFQNDNRPPPRQHGHQYQYNNYRVAGRPQQHEHVPPPNEYMRFSPSSEKFKRPIVIATSAAPYTEIRAEKQYDDHQNHHHHYDHYGQTRPTRPPVVLKPTSIYNYDNGGFLPTIPPTRPAMSDYYSPPAKPEKTRTRPKPKQRPIIPIVPATSTTTDKYGALNELLDGYDLGNKLSNKITADNIDSSIRTLSAVLNILQKGTDETGRPKRPKPAYRPDPIDDYDTGDDQGGNQGRPGVDYPTLSVIPKTDFDCKTQRYKGFFGDPETHCQVIERDNILRSTGNGHRPPSPSPRRLVNRAICSRAMSQVNYTHKSKTFIFITLFTYRHL